MFAEMIEGLLAPERLDELERLIRRELVPALRAEPGFSGAVSLFERDRGAALLVVLWETEEEAAGGRGSVVAEWLDSCSVTIWEVDARA